VSAAFAAGACPRLEGVAAFHQLPNFTLIAVGGCRATSAALWRVQECRWGVWVALHCVCVSGWVGRGAGQGLTRLALERYGCATHTKGAPSFPLLSGDQLARRDMAPAQREQLAALLDDTSAHWIATIANSRGKTEGQVHEGFMGCPCPSVASNLQLLPLASGR
jgi:hypothetical protein